MGIKKYKNSDDIIEAAIKNISVDRDILFDLISRLREDIEEISTPVTELGASQSMVKYVEGLIKSNEQLVKIASVMKGKKEIPAPTDDITEADRKSFFDNKD